MSHASYSSSQCQSTLNTTSIRTTTYHIECEPLQVRYVPRGSFFYKRFPVTRRTQSSDCSPPQTRRGRRPHSHIRQRMSRARLLTTATTIFCQSGFGDSGKVTYRYHSRSRQPRPNRAICCHKPVFCQSAMGFKWAMTYISVFLLSSPVVFFNTLVMSIMTSNHQRTSPNRGTGLLT